MVVMAAEVEAAMVAIPMVVMLMAREASMVLTYGKHRGSDISAMYPENIWNGC